MTTKTRTLTVSLLDPEAAAALMVFADILEYEPDTTDEPLDAYFWGEQLPQAINLLFIRLGTLSVEGRKLEPGDMADHRESYEHWERVRRVVNLVFDAIDKLKP